MPLRLRVLLAGRCSTATHDSCIRLDMFERCLPEKQKGKQLNQIGIGTT